MSSCSVDLSYDQGNAQTQKKLLVGGEYELTQHINTLGLSVVHSRDSSSLSRTQDVDMVQSLSSNLLQLTTGGDVDIESGLAVAIDSGKTIVQGNSGSSSTSHCVGNDFCLNENIFRGGHGDVWTGFKVSNGVSYILKRMNVKGRPDILRCAHREIYFGSQLRSVYRQVTRFEDYFIVDDDYWLVFVDEGISIQQFLYATRISGTTAILEPSLIWSKMRLTEDGLETTKNLMFQIIEGINELHSLGIVHRDIKPSNILVNANRDSKDVTVLISDFSSAISEACFEAGLYGNKSTARENLYEFQPSELEESPQYSPPEVLLCKNCTGAHLKYAYDVWSVGVLFLEIILGTADIFIADQRTQAMILHKLKVSKKKRSEHELEAKFRTLAYKAALAEFCIITEPIDIENDDCSGVNHNRSNNNMRQESMMSLCGVKDLRDSIKRRDPYGIGLNDEDALDLLSKLLKYDPTDRISMKDALSHPYFSSLKGKSFMKQQYEHQKGQEEYTRSDKMPTSSDEKFYRFINEPVRDILRKVDHDAGTSRHLQIGTGSWYNNSLLVTDAIDQLLDVSFPDLQGVISTNMDTSNLTFFCPCGKTYKGDSQSCQQHLLGRRHGKRCIYSVATFMMDQAQNARFDRRKEEDIYRGVMTNEEVLPDCVSDHSFLPLDMHSGWCDIQGRRSSIEDTHAVLFSEDSDSKTHFRFFGVFDGHFGNRAAQFATRYLPKIFERFLLFDQDTDNPVANLIDLNALLQNQEMSRSSDSWIRQFYVPYNPDESSSSLIARHVIESIYSAFISTNIEFLQRSNPREKSGTTATTVTLLRSNNHVNNLTPPTYKYMLVAHVGDSRAVFCCDEKFRAVPLTIDHTLSEGSERIRVLNKGGYFNSSVEGIERVNDQLAVTRSLGTRHLRKVLSAIPDIRLIDLDALANQIEKGRLDKNFTEEKRNDENKIGDECVKYFAKLREYSAPNSNRNLYQDQSYIKKFVIAGSDGLWDVFSNQDAVEFVCEYLTAEIDAYEKSDYSDNGSENVASSHYDRLHKAAKALSIEAFVRGSSDNIGVCIVDIL